MSVFPQEKKYFRIGEVSKIVGVEPYVLRYWEKEFPFLQPFKNKSGHRLYTRRDIAIIVSIKKLLYTHGYSIPGAKKILWKNLLKEEDSSSLSQKIEEIKRDLIKMLEVIEKTMDFK